MVLVLVQWLGHVVVGADQSHVVHLHPSFRPLRRPAQRMQFGNTSTGSRVSILPRERRLIGTGNADPDAEISNFRRVRASLVIRLFS